jgi:hypothetical protein
MFAADLPPQLHTHMRTYALSNQLSIRWMVQRQVHSEFLDVTQSLLKGRDLMVHHSGSGRAALCFVYVDATMENLIWKETYKGNNFERAWSGQVPLMHVTDVYLGSPRTSHVNGNANANVQGRVQMSNSKQVSSPQSRGSVLNGQSLGRIGVRIGITGVSDRASGSVGEAHNHMHHITLYGEHTSVLEQWARGLVLLGNISMLRRGIDHVPVARPTPANDDPKRVAKEMNQRLSNGDALSIRRAMAVRLGE